MNPRFIRIVIVWNIVLGALLLISLAANAVYVQAANDPPVHVFTASMDDVGAAGSGTIVDRDVTSTAYFTLAQIGTSALSANHSHVCVDTASANAEYLEGSGEYVFGVNVNDSTTIHGNSPRTIEMFDNNGINDDSFEEVTTTWAFENISGPNTFTSSARKASAADGDLRIDAAAMTVICLKKHLVPPTTE